MKKCFLILISALLCFCFASCGKSAVPMNDLVWKFDSALTQTAIQYGYTFAEAEDKKREASDERTLYIDCTLEANDRTFTIKDKTNNLTFSGTYKLKDIEPEVTNYSIEINGVEGYAVTGRVKYADGSEAKTLIISISDYTLNFFEEK